MKALLVDYALLQGYYPHLALFLGLAARGSALVGAGWLLSLGLPSARGRNWVWRSALVALAALPLLAALPFERLPGLSKTVLPLEAGRQAAFVQRAVATGLLRTPPSPDSAAFAASVLEAATPPTLRQLRPPLLRRVEDHLFLLALLPGIVLLAWRGVGAGLVAWRLRDTSPAPSGIAALAASIAAHFGLPHPPAVRLSPSLRSPLLVGCFRPRIVLPTSLREIDPESLADILTHEIAHQVRGDLGWQWFGLVAAAAWWWHPLAWFALRRMRGEAEQGADDLVLLRRPAGAAYAELLVGLALGADLRGSDSAIAMFGQFPLERRIQAILRESGWRGRVGWIGAGAAALCVLLGLGVGLWHVGFGLSRSALTAALLPARKPVLFGQVLDPSGKPAPNVEVRDIYFGGHSTRTDPTGHFVLPYLRLNPGCWRPVFAQTADSVGLFDLAQFAADSKSAVISLVPLGPQFHGKLVDQAGNPVVGATIEPEEIIFPNGMAMNQPFQGDDGTALKFWDLFAAQSDATGAFTVFLPPDTRTRLKAIAPGYGRLQFLLAGVPSDLGTTVMPPGGTLKGIALDKVTGQPLANAPIRAIRLSDDALPETGDTHAEDQFLSATDDQGRYRIENVRIGNYAVEVSRNRTSDAKDDRIPSPPVIALVEAGKESTAQPTVEAGRLVTGRILAGDTDQPVKKAYAIDFSPARISEGDFWSRKDGTFSTYFPPGQYYLYVNDGSNQYPHALVTVSATEDTPPVTLRTPTDLLTVTVTVKTEDGGPIRTPQAIVWLWDDNQAKGASWNQNLFMFGGFKKGSYAHFIVDAPGYAVWESPNFEVGDTTSSWQPVLKPVPTVTLRGRILDEEGKPMAGIRVYVSEHQGNEMQWTHPPPSWSAFGTDADGRFAIGDLRKGDQITLLADKLRDAKTPEMVRILDDPWGIFDSRGNGTPYEVTDDQDLTIPDVHARVNQALGPAYSDGPALPPLQVRNVSPPPIQKSPFPAGGVGVILRNADGPLLLLAVFKDGPAGQAGLLPGDLLTAVDGKAVKQYQEAMTLLHGEPGTKVQLTIERAGGAPQIFEAVRADLSKLFQTPQQQVVKMADAATLAAITLPDNPSRDQVKDYIQRIVAASTGQNQSSGSDPQVAMLEKVGDANLDLLLDPQSAGGGMVPVFIVRAVGDLAEDQDQALILSHLKDYPMLIQVVQKKRWEQAAKPILLESIRAFPDNGDPEWFSVIAGYKDPATYPDLTRVFVVSMNKYLIFQDMKHLPGFDLKGAVDQAWEHQKTTPVDATSDDYQMAVLAAPYGHRDALDYLVQVLSLHSATPNWLPGPGEAIHDAVEISSTVTDIPAWYAANKDNLQFDATRSKFILPK